jgi:hypothetical protein
MREADRRRLSVDVEAQLRAEAFACAVGPRPSADPGLLAALRRALLERVLVAFDYGGPRRRKVVPYGGRRKPSVERVVAVVARNQRDQLRAIEDVQFLENQADVRLDRRLLNAQLVSGLCRKDQF